MAILLAMGWHFNQVQTGFPPIDWVLTPGRLFGWAGVDVFFVLSGFLVGGLVFSELAKTGGFRPGRFLVRRALKIWPVLYLYLALTLVTGRHTWQSFLLQCLLHVQNYFATPLEHLWSLAVEEHFYTTLCLLFLVLARFDSRRRQIFLWLCASMPLICLGLRCLAFSTGVPPRDIIWQTQYRIDTLTCGVFLAYLFQFRRATFDRVVSYKAVWFTVFVFGFATVGAIGRDPLFSSTIGLTVTMIASAAFLLFCIDLPALVRGPAPVRLIAFLGIYSYAMYVYQFAGARAAEAVFQRLHIGERPVMVDVAVRYLAAVIAAVVVTKVVERPALAMRDRLFPSRILAQPGKGNGVSGGQAQGANGANESPSHL